MAVKKKNVKKPVKKAAPKKAVKKKVVKKQTGTTTIALDKLVQAKPVGKRKSKKGKTYYESRANRSDKGRLLGVPTGSIKAVNSRISLNLVGQELLVLEFEIAKLKQVIKQLRTAAMKKEAATVLKSYNAQFKALKNYLNTRAKFI